MRSGLARELWTLLRTRSGLFDAAVCLAGLGIFAYALAHVLTDPLAGIGVELFAVPMIVIVAQFPMVLDRGEGGIEVGFDSTILMFLLCTQPAAQALVLWAIGMILSAAMTQKRLQARIFNIGNGILGGAVAAGTLTLTRGSALGTPRELLAVALAATAYFAFDYLLSAVSLAIEEQAPLSSQLLQRGTIVAVACFVPFDSLGYLGAVLVRSSSWWVLGLLAVPLATLLIATRAVTRGSENARRLSVLFAAAERAQTLRDTREVVAALEEDARRLLQIDGIEVRDTPPGPQEIGAKVHDGGHDRYVVAPDKHRARSTAAADSQALEAMAAVSSDAFERLRLNDEMAHLARHDLLTDLPNRRLLLDRVEQALSASRRNQTRVALLFVDLDGFKPVNDRFGHAAGDAVLVDVAQRLSACVRGHDMVARLGGDEFAVLFEDVGSDVVTSACYRILAALMEGVEVNGHQLPLSCSIGVAYGDQGDTAQSMLRNADLAMYEAKSRGKNQFVDYEPAIGRSRLQRLELVEALRAAVSNKDIRTVYQPVVDTVSGRISGVEALARWRLDGRDIRPDVFIKVAEESGLVVPLGELILERASRDAQRLRDAAGGMVTVSVNVAAQQLREPAFVPAVERALARMGGTGLILEITERDGIGTDVVTSAAMQTLVDMGVVLAIDDFGVGFSSISYLQDMPVGIIKTDATFSAAIDKDERACALLSSITTLAGALGLSVVVEGIERESQLEHLIADVHARYAQGYLLHRPMPLQKLLRVVRDQRPAEQPAVPAAVKPAQPKAEKPVKPTKTRPAMAGMTEHRVKQAVRPPVPLAPELEALVAQAEALVS
ncbi:EAL domain-containing protein [Nocardioides mangrovicus]|uniref:EAL domain-containing protein n=1 Tax=Nocardioides mangrovicus TaxID=2478913 RepID=A0A3L8P605_9ACTN|nr:EAL domain-containing protein [Nocardioides mangrovicus]RLV50840.1 EAL domain-containing protein [Nocardioides mangrovicus]